MQTMCQLKELKQALRDWEGVENVLTTQAWGSQSSSPHPCEKPGMCYSPILREEQPDYGHSMVKQPRLAGDQKSQKKILSPLVEQYPMYWTHTHTNPRVHTHTRWVPCPPHSTPFTVKYARDQDSVKAQLSPRVSLNQLVEWFPVCHAHGLQCIFLAYQPLRLEPGPCLTQEVC